MTGYIEQENAEKACFSEIRRKKTNYLNLDLKQCFFSPQ